MQIGFNLPISGPLSEPAVVTRIAQEGEAMGYDYLTLTDHILLPNLKVPGYPYSESGEFFGEGPQNRHDQLTAAADIAADLRALRELGVSAVDIDFERPDPDTSLAQMRRFQDTILARL